MFRKLNKLYYLHVKLSKIFLCLEIYLQMFSLLQTKLLVVFIWFPIKNTAKTGEGGYPAAHYNTVKSPKTFQNI